jgi:lipid-A-disaccharide synthase-like uncharacterized protein
MNGLSNLMGGHFQLDVWAAIGFLGQALFTTRFLVQWLASERKRASVVPNAFWYFSLIGGTISLVYAVAIGSLPFALGQVTGLLVYSRNLYLIHRKSALAPAD